MKTTTSLLDIIEAKAHRLGYNAIRDEKGYFRLADDNTSIMSQVARYTDFIKECTQDEIFGGYSFKDQSTDIFFKKMFLAKFLNREIKFQTLDLFREKLVYMMISNEQWFTNVYLHYNDMFNAQGLTGGTSEAHESDETRGANATLPQDNTGLDLGNDIVDYADNTLYNKHKQDQNGKTTSNQRNYNASVIEKLNNIYNRKLDEFDAELFLQIW